MGCSDLVDLWVIKIKKPTILCARSTPGSCSENMWKVCLSYRQNNKIVWLLNTTDTFFWARYARVCELFLLDFSFRLLIGWAGKLQSYGRLLDTESFHACSANLAYLQGFEISLVRRSWGQINGWVSVRAPTIAKTCFVPFARFSDR